MIVSDAKDKDRESNEMITKRPIIIIDDDDNYNCKSNIWCCSLIFKALMCYFCYSKINNLSSGFDSDNED
jgi:hypothetical protein